MKLSKSFGAGLLLGATYIYSRRLWLPIAIHFALELYTSGIFGTITSGNDDTPGLLTTQLTGAEWITGGRFGPEARSRRRSCALSLHVCLRTPTYKMAS